MERTIYFNQTRPSDVQLNWSDNSKVNAIKRRTRALAQMGIKSGFEVTVNVTDDTKIDIAIGEGYGGGKYLINTAAGNSSGERISTTQDIVSGEYDAGPILGVALADYTAGVKNYVSLIYAETNSYPLAERSYPFTQHDTVVTETFTVSVLTATDWAALSDTDLDNRILIAIVTAPVSGGITDALIEQFTQPRTNPITSQPASILGVTITAVADTTPLGTATLRWDSSTHKLYWTAPRDTEGAGVTITQSGTFTVYSNNTTYTLLVDVIYASLSPVSSTSESITIKSLYGRNIPMFSAIDQIHRDMIGTGALSVHNPHALSLNDISGGLLDHAELFHVNGISYAADSTQLACAALEPGSSNYVRITNLGGFHNSFLIDGVTLENLAGVAVGSPVDVSFDTGPSAGDYLIYVDSDGVAGKLNIAEVAGAWSLWTTNIRIMDIRNKTAGSGAVITWSATNNTLTYAAPGDSAGSSVYVTGTGYYKLYSSSADLGNWIVVQVTGALGGNNSSTFKVNKDETTYPDSSMLKLCIVHWDLATQSFSTLRDIRSYITADVKSEFEEEHDALGHHTKVLQQPLQVAISSSHALAALAGSEAIYGSVTGNAGIYGLAQSAIGVMGVANSTGVYGNAPSVGVMGAADVATGVYGQADESYGVAGSAANTAIYGTADTAYAIYGIAGSSYGGYFSATETALYASAATRAGVFHASNFGVSAVVTHGNAVYAKASTWAVQASATSQAVYVVADDKEAVYAAASVATGVYGAALGSIGVKGYAGTATGVYGYAVNSFGVVGEATHTGVYGYASGTYGVYGSAAVIYGVYGKAVTIGICGTASGGNAATPMVGVYGQAENVSVAYAIGVEGYAAGAGATGVHGSAAHASFGTGVYGSAGSGDPTPGVFGAYGVYGMAGYHGVGVYGIAGLVGVLGTASFAYGVGVRGVNTVGGSHGTGGQFFGDDVGVECSGGVYGIDCAKLIRYGESFVALGGHAIDSLLPIQTTAGLRYIAIYT